MRLFVRRVRSEPGVIDCRLVRQEGARKPLVFRIVFTRDEFPEGILNHLLGIDELKLAPKS